MTLPRTVADVLPISWPSRWGGSTGPGTGLHSRGAGLRPTWSRSPAIARGQTRRAGRCAAFQSPQCSSVTPGSLRRNGGSPEVYERPVRGGADRALELVAVQALQAAAVSGPGGLLKTYKVFP